MTSNKEKLNKIIDDLEYQAQYNEEKIIYINDEAKLTSRITKAFYKLGFTPVEIKPRCKESIWMKFVYEL